MLTLFFAFLVAPVNPHLSKYVFILIMVQIAQLRKVENSEAYKDYLATVHICFKMGWLRNSKTGIKNELRILNFNAYAYKDKLFNINHWFL